MVSTEKSLQYRINRYILTMLNIPMSTKMASYAEFTAPEIGQTRKSDIPLLNGNIRIGALSRKIPLLFQEMVLSRGIESTARVLIAGSVSAILQQDFQQAVQKRSRKIQSRSASECIARMDSLACAS
tara:strand:+ start:550 stop:930 length:381 start_codon:yes stop_codon:yes gene_type:complete